jgi:hypothetical protein
MPTRPPLFTRKYVAEDEPTANAGPLMPLGFTESKPHGVDEPTPSAPAEVIVVVPVAPNDAVSAASTLLKMLVPVAFAKVRVPFKILGPLNVLEFVNVLFA